MTKTPFFKTKIGLAVIIIVGIVLIFFIGSEYRAYKVRKAIDKVFNTDTTSEPASSKNIIQKNIGDEFQLAMGTIKINSVEEKSILSGGFSSPVSAKEGTKFVVVDLDITNTTSDKITFSSSNMYLVDNKDRNFETYDDTIGNVDNYLEMRDLAPSIKENGLLVFELPNDATTYAFQIDKNGTNDRFMVKLK